MHDHIIAIATYGSQRVKSALTGQTVSAYKMGYSSAASAVLLALYGEWARDVASKHATYHYIQVDADVTVRHGHILLKITDAEQRQVEALTRQVHRPAVYKWCENTWMEFPNLNGTSYTAIGGRTGPTFNPTGMRIAVAATDTVEAAISGITVEKNQRDPDKKPWFWLRGDTYPHRETLRRWGGRWSKKRKAWYFIVDALPDAIQALVDRHPSPQPSSREATPPIEAAEHNAVPFDDGLTLMPDTLIERIAQAKREASHHKNMIYAKLFMADGDWYLFVNDINPSRREIFCYAVLNGDFQMAEWGWQSLDDLQAVRGRWQLPMERDISFEPKALEAALTDLKRQRGLLSHEPPAEADEETASSETCVCEAHDGPKGWLPVETLGTWVACGRCNPKEENRSEDMEDDTPSIRVIKPNLTPTAHDEPDAVLTALRETKPDVLPVFMPPDPRLVGRRSLISIPQSSCGELSGSITGNVWCYGWAMHAGICIYLNCGGPRMAVEAIRAKLVKGDVVNCVPWDDQAVELTAGEGNSGMYTAYLQNIPEAKFTSLILLHEQVTQPNYGGKSTTFILQINEAQAMAQLHQHVTHLVKVPVFADWIAYLWQKGQTAKLVRRTRGQGGLPILAVELDVDAWTRLITGGLAENIITLPANR